MNWIRLRKDLFFDGFRGVFIECCYRILNSFTFFKVLRCMVLHENSVPEEIQNMHDDYDKHFLSTKEIELVKTSEINRLPSEVIDTALTKRDACLGLKNGDLVINYCWYSDRPTRLNEDLVITFHKDYKYAYRSFTIPPYRGKRLQGLNLYIGLKHYKNVDFKGIIAYVDANNFNSLRSFNHVGFENFGWMWILKIGRKYHVLRSKKCDDFNFHIQISEEAASQNRSILYL